MTYDQAQSPRLGQRTPVESTYVQIFDADPGTETADLIEAAWPGMLIFRRDLSILQIYNAYSDPPGWESVAGGTAGQLTYVGPSAPSGPDISIGDVWYDSDDGYRQYVWDGDSWEAPAGGGGINTYYETGFIPNPAFDPDLPADPDTNPYNLWVPLAGSFNTGDLWYQIDDDHHPFRWNGTAWMSVLNPDIPYIEQNQQAIIALDTSLRENELLAFSANNTADTADGRISMSDYVPGPDDVTYLAWRIQTNPDTGLPETVYYETPRQNGSVWFTRTRPRRNLCTNPSFEVDTSTWTSSQCSIARVAAANDVAGAWALEVTNSAVSGPHEVSWSEASKRVCVEGQFYTASAYAELISGTANGVTMEIRWYDSGDALIETTVGEPVDLAVDAWNAAAAGSTSEPRFWVTGEAPVGAVSFYISEVSPAGSESAVWRTSAVLVEQEDDLGRYFDGTSYDCSWDGAVHLSESLMEGDKIIQVWELRDQDWVRKYFTDETIYSLSAHKLIGTMDGTVIADNSIPTNKQIAAFVVSSEALTAGDIVNVWNSAGTFKVRKACAGPANRAEAHGFVMESVAADQLVRVYHVGYNRFLTELSPGNQFLSGTAGLVTNQPPTTIGAIVQGVGFAPLDYVLNFNPSTPVRLI